MSTRTHNKKIKIIRVNCPLCGSSQKKVIYDRMTDVEDKIPGEYTISLCMKCNLIYLSTRPSRANLPDIYRRDYHVYAENIRTRISKFIYHFKHAHDFRLIDKIVHEIPRSLIDIGFGSGSLLMEIHNRWGDKIELAGIELDKPLTDHLDKAGIKVHVGEMEKMKPSKKYQVVMMNEILEHVYNPVEALQAVKGWLAKDGMLIGEVPDYASPFKSVFPKHWQGFQIPRHMTFFDKNTLRKVLEKAGYEVISIGNRINHGDIGVSLTNLVVNKINPETRPRLSRLYLPIVVGTVPIIYVMDKLFKTPGILEFVARKIH